MKENVFYKMVEYNAIALNVITFLIGVVLVLIATFIGLSKIGGIILVSIGTSIIASSIVVYLSSKYLFKQNRIKDIIEKWGLNGIFRTRAEMNESTNEKLKDSVNNLDIIAFGLKNFRDNQDDLIKNKVLSGMQIRILTSDTESQFIAQREIDEGQVAGQIKNTIIQLTHWVDNLKQVQTYQKQVQIKYYNSLPLDFYFKVDNAIFIGPYLYGRDSQQTISYEFCSNSQGYEYYANYFERLWNDGSFAKEIE